MRIESDAFVGIDSSAYTKAYFQAVVVNQLASGHGICILTRDMRKTCRNGRNGT